MLHLPRSCARIVPLTLVCACVVAGQTQRRSSALDYLYPEGVPAQAPEDVKLDLPLRVGIAFAPADHAQGDAVFDEQQRRSLLQSVATAFRGRPEIEVVELVPTHDLRPGGGFDNLEQVGKLYDLEVVALLSYEQVQFDEETAASWTYLTIVGAYVIQGNRNQTRTLIDASVFDLGSRTLLFRASGSSEVEKGATAVDALQAQRDASREGFGLANAKLIEDLDRSLAAFREQIKSGTVRGPGTPAVSVTESGAGAFGAFELALVALLVAGLVRAGGREAERGA